MSRAETQQQTFPAVPPPLSAGDHEMRDYYADHDIPRPPINQTPYLTPYLGLRARLSQVWINRWTILLLLVLVRTIFAIATISDSLDSARAKALSACSGVEAMGSAMASMPHYMSQGVNAIAATGVEKAVNGLMSMIGLSITAVQEIVVFVINLLTSTYVCLITLAVSGSLHAALDLVDTIRKFLDQNLGAIGDSIGKGVDGFTSELNKFVSTLNSIPFVNNKVPKLDVSGDVNKLKTLQLPPGLGEDLKKLNSSIPNFKEVNQLTNDAIRFPFQKVKGLISSSFGNYTFDRSVFPVPEKEKISFCTGDDGINEFFDSLVNLVFMARKVFIAVLVILAIAACIPMTYREIRRWRTMRKRAHLISKQAYDPLDVVYIASRPYTSTFGMKLAGKFKSDRRQNLIRWAVAYATTVPALFVLSLGIAGLFGCLCQYILLQIIKKEVPQLENQVGAFADKVVTSLNTASQKWALGVNGVIEKTNSDINQNIFGWVNISTGAVNDTLNVFVDTMSDGLNKTFGGTVLYDPIKDVLDCLITLKVQGVQKGLTWVSDHAHVDFPELPMDTFSLGAVKSISNDSTLDSFLANPGTKSKDEISEAVISVVRRVQEGIRQEAIISTCVILIWVIIALIGIGRAISLFCGRDKTRAEGGQAYAADPDTDNNLPRDIRPESVAPSYEYATRKQRNNNWRPRKLETFEPESETFNSSTNETYGDVSAHNAGLSVRQPTHQRASTYAHLTGPSPVNEKTRDL